jgi:hypothetical protein
MSVVTRRLSAAVLFGAVLAFGVSCTSSDDPVSPPVEAPSESLIGLVENLTNLRLLSCSPQPYAVTTQTVGPDGGVIVVGTHRLSIPRGALDRRVTIKAEQVRDRVNSVRFSPEGLRFKREAKLTLSYRNCSPLMLLKRVVYVNELLRILDLLPSRDDRINKTVTGDIKHFSRYAVAW